MAERASTTLLVPARQPAAPTTAPARDRVGQEVGQVVSGVRPVLNTAAQVQVRAQAPAPVTEERSGFPDALLGILRGWAAKLPPYELLTVLIGRDPLGGGQVERSARNVLRAALKLHPDGPAIFAELEREKTVETVTAWFEAQVARLDLTWGGVRDLLARAWDAIGWTGLLNPGRALERAREILGPALTRLASFAGAVLGKAAELLRRAALGKIGAWARTQRGYPLLTVVLGRDPVTGEAVAATPVAFVQAVLALVPGGDEMFKNLQQAKTVERTVGWLREEITRLDLTWESVAGLFRQAWDAFSIADLLHPLDLVVRTAAIFGPPVRRLLVFAVAVGRKVLEFVFEGAMHLAGPIGRQILGIVRKASATFDVIVADPIGFAGNLMAALKLGFQQFGRNILEHLKNGLIAWLVGALEGAGLVLPKVWDVKGVLSFALQVLGVTYAKMRVKIVKVIGEERVAMLERVFELVRLLVVEGPAAAWERIMEAVGSVWDAVIGGIRGWAVTRIVTAAVTRLAAMLNPVGAVLTAIKAIYDTVAFFVEKIKEIASLVEAIVDSVAAIAAGKLGPAANWVERAMGRAIPVMLSFLARLIGLGDVSGQIRKIVTELQKKVDAGIDRAIAWIVEKAKSLLGRNAAKPHDERWAAAVAGISAEIAAMEEKSDFSAAAIGDRLPLWQKTFGLTRLGFKGSGAVRKLTGAMSPEDDIAEVGSLGTKEDPFPLVYPKPKSLYRDLYLPTDAAAAAKAPRRTQAQLKRIYDADGPLKASLGVERFRPFPTTPKKLGGMEIGIAESHVIGRNAYVGPLTTAGTGGGYLINDLLEKHGYERVNAEGETTQGDHHWEIQFGGVNTRANLWPLAEDANRASGNYLKNLKVRLPGGRVKPVSELKHNTRKYWFLVVDVRRPS